ncbi:MAG: molybdate ABC transporter substrate-binding protein [Sandaracinaceae bacterium]
MAARPDREIRLAAVALWLAVASGCTPERETVSVFAASSFADAALSLESGFEARHPALDLVHANGGSQVLRLQIEQGAPADVFVSANREHVDALVAAGRAEDPRTVAESELVIIVPQDNPADVRQFEDLARAPRLVVGHAATPIGQYTAHLFERAAAVHGPSLVAAIRARVVSEESNVRRVRAKVELGEADAAIVYRADASPGVRLVELAPALRVRATYHAAQVAGSPHGAVWLDYLAGPEGRAALTHAGFE